MSKQELEQLTAILDRFDNAQKGDWISADVELQSLLNAHPALRRLWDFAIERGKREAREER